jgi:protein-disulfide isomerase
MGRRFGLLLLMLLALTAAPVVALAQTVDPVRADDRTTGAVDAPVTLTVYLSTTCGHCARWHQDEYPAFKAKYVDTGKVRVVWRDLPTPPQRLAVAGMTMARCAPAERYEAALDALFKGQAIHLPQGQAREWLIAGGTAGGLSQAQMQACLSAENVAAAEARGEKALAEGVNSTPSFFIDGEAFAPATPGLAAFDAVIQPLLAGR